MSQGISQTNGLTAFYTHDYSDCVDKLLWMETQSPDADFIHLCLGQLSLLDEQLKSNQPSKLNNLLRALHSNLANIHHPELNKLYWALQPSQLEGKTQSKIQRLLGNTRELLQQLVFQGQERKSKSKGMTSNDHEQDALSLKKRSYFVETLSSTLIHQDHEAVELATENLGLLNAHFGENKACEILDAIQNFQFNRALLLIQNHAQ